MREIVLLVVALVASALINLPGLPDALPDPKATDYHNFKVHRLSTPTPDAGPGDWDLTPTPYVPWSPLPTPTRTWD